MPGNLCLRPGRVAKSKSRLNPGSNVTRKKTVDSKGNLNLGNQKRGTALNGQWREANGTANLFSYKEKVAIGKNARL